MMPGAGGSVRKDGRGSHKSCAALAGRRDDCCGSGGRGRLLSLRALRTEVRNHYRYLCPSDDDVMKPTGQTEAPMTKQECKNTNAEVDAQAPSLITELACA
jgi:hypothetical protein